MYSNLNLIHELSESESGLALGLLGILPCNPEGPGCGELSLLIGFNPAEVPGWGDVDLGIFFGGRIFLGPRLCTIIS